MKNVTRRLFVLALLAAIAVIGTRSWHAPFVMDDVEQLSHVQSFSRISDCVGPDCYGLFRPVKNLLYWAVLRAGESPATVAHLISIFLFSAATLMVYGWFGLFYSKSPWPIVGAALWALAPTQVSSLVWFSCVNILISLIFTIASLRLYEQAQSFFLRKKPAQAVALLGGCLASYAIAFLAYEAAIVLPALAALQDLGRRRKLLNRTTVASLGALASLGVALVVFRWLAVGSRTPANPGFAPLSDLALVGSSAYFLMDHFLWWMFPFGRQEVLGTYGGLASVATVQHAAAWMALLLGVGFCATRIRKHPLAVMGFAWFVIAALPVINILPLQTGPFADYYLVLPGIGLCVVVVELLRLCIQTPAAPSIRAHLCRLALPLVAVWRGAAAILCILWAANWNDPTVLLSASVRARPHAWRAQAELARLYAARNDLPQAERLALDALAAAPWLTMPYNVLGDIRNQAGDHTAAKEWFMRAVNSNMADDYTHYALAYTCETWLDDAATARKHYRLAIQSGKAQPFRENAFLNLGRLLAIAGESQAAIEVFRRGLAEYPRSTNLRHNLSIAIRRAEPASGPE